MSLVFFMGWKIGEWINKTCELTTRTARCHLESVCQYLHAPPNERKRNWKSEAKSRNCGQNKSWQTFLILTIFHFLATIQFYRKFHIFGDISTNWDDEYKLASPLQARQSSVFLTPDCLLNDGRCGLVSWGCRPLLLLQFLGHTLLQVKLLQGPSGTAAQCGCCLAHPIRGRSGISIKVGPVTISCQFSIKNEIIINK